jgi:RND family efflux transporter MFP subunit
MLQHPSRFVTSSSAITLITALVIVLTACESESESSASRSIRTVWAETVRPASQMQDRTFSGTLRAPLETNLSFRVPGQVTDVFVDVGTAVEAGDRLARLDPEDYRLEVEAARASYREAKAAAENARAEMKRVRSLYADDNTSLSAYDRAKTQLATTENRAEAAERKLQLAKKRLGYTVLTAPESGSIGRKFVQEGENVRSGQPVVRLTGGEGLEVQVQIPEDLISRIEVGRSATVVSPMRPDSSFHATVTEVASAPGGSRPTYPVVVALDEAAPGLRSGMTARVAFDGRTQQRIVVPPEAVGSDGTTPFVFVVESSERADSTAADGTIARRRIETGALTPEGLVVTNGLSAGDRVVTAGGSSLRSGTPVRISRLLSDTR